MKFNTEEEFLKVKEAVMSKIGASNDNQLSILLKYSANSAISEWNKKLTIPDKILRKYYDNTKKNEKSGSFALKKVTSYKVSAGGGNDIDSIEVYETGDTMQLDKAFFKVPPSKTLRVIQVDGYSMIPMLLPDSWVIFDEISHFKSDGLYIINYNGQLMVKLLQLNPNGILDVISKNPDYKSYQIDLSQNNEYFNIIGKVIKCIV